MGTEIGASSVKRFGHLVDDGLDRTSVAEAGGKGANLAELARAGLPVPPGLVITTDAYRSFVALSGIAGQIVEVADAVVEGDDASAEQASAAIVALFEAHQIPAELAESIEQAYAELGDRCGAETPVTVAVRSSATAEDLAEASFAGQQDTYLGIRGVDDLLVAVVRCWASLWTPRAIAYRRRARVDSSNVALAVVVQQLVDAERSGVMFTANPINGRRDQLIISAAWGLGESVVGGTVDTDSMIIERVAGDRVGVRLGSVETGDKQVMTVLSGGSTSEIEVPAEQRQRRVLSDEQAIELAALGVRMDQHYGVPLDIEWAQRDDTGLMIVQARPITALPEPTGDRPTRWEIPQRRTLYARASIVEQLPDPLSPLFADLITEAVPESLGRLMTTRFGRLVKEGDVGFPTINGYAYYSYTAGSMIKMSALAPFIMPRLIAKGEGSVESLWREVYRPSYLATIEDWQDRRQAGLNAVDLLHGVRELTLAGTIYYTCVQMIIPVATTAETVFTSVYERSLRRAADPPAVTFLLGNDNAPLRAERELWDLGRWCADHPALLALLHDRQAHLDEVPVDDHGLDDHGRENSADHDRRLVSGPCPMSLPTEVWVQWQQKIAAYLESYGHALSTLDFIGPLAADTPGPVLDTLWFYASGEATDPHRRQQTAASDRAEVTSALLKRLDPVRRRLIGAVLRKAQHFAPIREDALFDIGLAWPTIRRFLAELGGRLVDGGLLEQAADVCWLHEDELLACAAELDEAIGDGTVAAAATKVAPSEIDRRRMVWRGQRLAVPPQVLPAGGLNRVLDRFLPGHTGDQTGDELVGLGASGGRVTAEASLVLDPSDFGNFRSGQVLVARMTTPAYTPLFARAAAVVTDIGGPLSHSSIVAREYGIPAVLGVGVATQRITAGQTITVDGTAGTVNLVPS